LEQARLRNQGVKAQAFQINQAQADIDRVYGEFAPKLEAIAGIGPITGTTGNPLQSQEDTNKWGVTFLGSLELTYPIYAWGRKDDYLAAANRGKLVKETELRKSKLELEYKVKQAYYGALFGLSLRDFVRDAKADVIDALKKLKKGKKEDRYRLEIFLAQLAGKAAEIEKGVNLAFAGLGLHLGYSTKDQVEPVQEWIEVGERKLEPFAYYLSLADKHKPEKQQLAFGIAAKEFLAKAEFKGQLPTIGLLAKYDFAQTDVREDQQSVFANDPYNRDNFIIGLGVKWDFQWGLQSAKAAKYRAEAQELEAKQLLAQVGIPVLIKKAWLETKEATARLLAATRAYRLGKKWLSRATMGQASGLGDTKRYVEAYQARAEAIFRHHMAWAELSRTVGIEVDPRIK